MMNYIVLGLNKQR